MEIYAILFLIASIKNIKEENRIKDYFFMGNKDNIIDYLSKLIKEI